MCARGRFARWLALVVALAMCGFGGTAEASTVWVSVGTTATGTPNRAILHLVPGVGETNTVRIETAGRSAGEVSYLVRDASAPVAAGARCQPGSTASDAICSVPRSRPASACSPPGLCAEGGLRVELDLRLGAGGGSLDLSAIGAGDGGGGRFSTTLTGGPAAETITGSGADDRIDSGAGGDIIRAGEGSDFVEASVGGADGPDLIDLGGGALDMASYQLASGPLTVSLDGVADDGTAGEADNVVGAEYVLGGAGEDLLVGSEAGEALVGGGGDDVLRGFGGDDRLAGGEGLDPLGGGRDRLDGGAGDDLLAGGDEADRVLGRAGRDRIVGGAGDDRLQGGPRSDRLDGGDGRDRLGGGPGGDLLDGGEFEFAPIPDDARDRLGCGPGHDRAREARRDVTRRCERVRAAISASAS